MITICLDEYGNFEMQEKVFVGGVVYKGDDYEEERKRIIEYLKSEVESCGGEFPNDLHRNYKNSNEKIVRNIKVSISNSIEKYLKNSGRYHIVCMLKSKKGRSDLKNKSNLLDDNIASNRYEHMACSTLNDLIFNNIVLKPEETNEVNLDIATRMAVVTLDKKEKIENFEKLGYKKKEGISYFNKEAIGFYATDEKTYKTYLSSLMMCKGRENINFKRINVQSIDYKNSMDSMEFLYLADFICNNISGNIDFEKKDLSIMELFTWSKNVTGENEPFIWVYDEIDGIYSRVMDKFHGNDVYELLSYMYDGIVGSSDFREFYEKIWFKAVRKQMSKCCKDNFIEFSIKKLENYLHSKDMIQDKAVFIFNNLWELVKTINDESKLKDKAKLAKDKYMLANTGIAVFNHKGDTKRTEEFYKECESLKESVDIEVFLSTVNRAAVIYADKFEFDKAYKFSKYNVECFEILKDAKKQIANLNSVDNENTYLSVELGKALSSCGQYLAFQRDSKAINEFEKALAEFKEDLCNKMVTLSYILHHAIDINNKDLYEKYCVEYFNGNIELEEQFKYIVNMNTNENTEEKNKNYSMYVFIKAINKFYTDEVSDNLVKSIRETDYKVKDFNISGHPWEIIYRYIGILLYNKDLSKYAQSFMEKAYTNISESETTIIAINYLTKMQEAYYNDNINKLSKQIKEFELWTEKSGIKDYFSDSFKENSIMDKYKKIYDKFTYTYA